MGNRPLVAYYGDDFTGSTDVLEALTLAGLRTMLFLTPPDSSNVGRYGAVDAVGVAGTSRSQSPEWMDANLPAIFTALKALNPRYCHYKTCSTFDSAPHVGNIGRGIEIGQQVFGQHQVPVLVGVPQLGRYVIFGNLFAKGSGGIHRIDRHPTMSRHPTTPMLEADLVRHLAVQTGLAVANANYLDLLAGRTAKAAADVLILDTFDAATALAAGNHLAEMTSAEPRFIVGSSGVEYALLESLRQSGKLAPGKTMPRAGVAAKIFVASGSCSPVTAEQVDWAEANGFVSIAASAAAIVTDPQEETSRLVSEAVSALGLGKCVVVHTARGPEDPRIVETRAALDRKGHAQTQSAEILGKALGRVMREVIERSDLSRSVFSGGDSTSHATSAMGIDALEMIAPLTPGSPLCSMRASNRRLDGVQIVMKGGQVGGPDYFQDVQQGRA